MAKKAMIVKQQKTQKYKTREYNRCKLCGRPHAHIKVKFQVLKNQVGKIKEEKRKWLQLIQ